MEGCAINGDQTNELHALFEDLQNFHNIHGFTVVVDQKKTHLQRIYYGLLWCSAIFQASIALAASSERFVTLSVSQHALMFILGTNGYYATICEVIFWFRKSQIRNLLDWCQWADSYTPSPASKFVKPRNWFLKKQQNVRFVVK